LTLIRKKAKIVNVPEISDIAQSLASDEPTVDWAASTLRAMADIYQEVTGLGDRRKLELPPTYHKAKPVALRELGCDERWLQERILDDPSILGLGDVTVVQRERRQRPGGRLDFLLSEPDENVMYEVEVMLGRVDESHIIRTIEYWDIERRRWPSYDHQAVIIAEEITNRFFNVIGLLNRGIPIVAVQLSAFLVDDKVILTFAKVLDIYEPPGEEEADAELADRQWWEKHSNKESFGIVDRVIGLLSESNKPPRVTYNRNHVALGGARQNFCWCHPRKSPHCLLNLKVGLSGVEATVAKLEEVGIAATPRRKETISVRITQRELSEHEQTVKAVLLAALNEVGGGRG
jgi:hypothetical protein